MIHTQSLQYKYKEGKHLSFPDIMVQSNDQWLLTGKSGSGKTTFIHLLAGILSPLSGDIIVHNTNISKFKQSGLDKFRAKNIGLIFQKNLFINSLNMFQNLLITQKVAKAKTDKQFIEHILDELHITELSTKKPFELSQGEQQRFSIARALVNKPKVVLADEPTSSLDDENCNRFIELIKTTCLHYNAALLIATHDSRLKQYFKNSISLS